MSPTRHKPLTAEQQDLVSGAAKMVNWATHRAGFADDHPLVELARDLATEKLVYAASKFDPSRGFKFTTLAGCSLRGLRGKVKKHISYRGREKTLTCSFDEEFSGVGRATRDPDPVDRDALEMALSMLDHRERHMVMQRVGHGVPLGEIGKAHGVTKERARQVINGAIVKMREAFQ